MGALAAVYVSYGLAMGLAFVVFVVARQLAAAAFGARGGLAPFGEPPSAAFAQARRGARLAVTVAGPLALYVVATLLVAIGWLFAGPGQPSTRLHAAVPGMPAAKAGLLAEDRIVALDGERVSNPEEVRSFMHRDGREAVAVTVRRAGAELTVPVTIDHKRQIGVQFASDPPTPSDAFTNAVLLAPHTMEALAHSRVEVAGPVAIARAVGSSAHPAAMVLLAASTMIAIWIVPLFAVASLLLLPVGGARRPDAAPPASAPSAPGRPWARLCARLVDTTLVWCVVLLGTGLASRTALNLGCFVAILAIVPIEALLLASFGTTPGKWMLGLAVVDTAGGRPRLRVALRRAALVLTYGLTVGMSLGIATTVLAHRHIATSGSAYWDDLEGLTATHRDVPWWRKALAGAVLVGFVVLQVAIAVTVAR